MTVPNPLVSIILRTRNEERWVASCLRRIASQTHQSLEVILVDNASTDRTVDRARAEWPDLTLVEVDEFLPGDALNRGIQQSSGEYCVCLSAHCIPRDQTWLENLLKNFGDDSLLAGVYGRQIPMHFTTGHDKRDLIVTFGLDRRVQYRDPFFHNANSILPRAIWDRFPFDATTTNIEDRLWAKQVLAAGYHLIYEPEAQVYHHHGIYQNRNENRLRNVIRIMESDSEIPTVIDPSNPFHPETITVAALIPVRRDPAIELDLQQHLLGLAIGSAQAAAVVQDVYVTTDHDGLAEYAELCGASILNRSIPLDTAPVAEVLRCALSQIEDSRTRFLDYVVTLEITHPFRPHDIVQRCVEKALNTGLDCVVAGVPEYRPCWYLESGEYKRIDDFLHQRTEREPVHVGLPALCTVLTPQLLRCGQRLTQPAGIVELHDPLAMVEIRSTTDFHKFQSLVSLV